MATKAVAKKADKVPAVAGAFDYGEDAGAGFEGTKGTDLSIPFISILQSNSPQVENEDPEGAKSGMLFNTVTRDLADGDKGLAFLPCHKDMAYVEWVPRKAGGGFVGLHNPEGDDVARAIENNDGNRIGKLKHGENELVETHYVYGLVLDEDSGMPVGFAVVSFTSTKIKPFRDWHTAMYTQRGKPPLFANRARIRTVKRQNEHGTFYNFRIDPLNGTWRDSLINPAKEGQLLTEAKEFRDMVVSGVARAAFETQDAAGGETGDQPGEKPPF